MGEVIRISISFPLPVTLSDVAHQTLHDALELICAEYERAHPDRVMWAAGEGGTPPPGWYFEESKGDWDMSVLNIEVAERKRYDTDRAFKLSASAELRAHIAKEIERLERVLPRKQEMAQSDNWEVRHDGATFAKKYERDLRILKLAQHALGLCPAKPNAKESGE